MSFPSMLVVRLHWIVLGCLLLPGRITSFPNPNNHIVLLPSSSLPAYYGTTICGSTTTTTQRPRSRMMTQWRAVSKDDDNNDNDNDKNHDVVALLHSHHLLDHKPDTMILKGGKYKLRGVGCLGRPGVALCIGPLPFLSKFQSKLQSTMPQKKFKRTVLEIDDLHNKGAMVSSSSSSSSPASSSSSKVLPELKDFTQVTLGELRTYLETLGHEDVFFTLTGIDPSIASPSSSSSSSSSSHSANHSNGGGSGGTAVPPPHNNNKSKSKKSGKRKRKR